MTLCIKRWQLKLASFIKDARTEWVKQRLWHNIQNLAKHLSVQYAVSYTGRILTLWSSCA